MTGHPARSFKCRFQLNRRQSHFPSFNNNRRPLAPDQLESISRLSDNGPEDVARMSQRLVDTAFGDFNGGDVAVARVQQNDTGKKLGQTIQSSEKSG